MNGAQSNHKKERVIRTAKKGANRINAVLGNLYEKGVETEEIGVISDNKGVVKEDGRTVLTQLNGGRERF